jgi:predicted SnoaL-like aldol condensation-catalyzing enzyme
MRAGNESGLTRRSAVARLGATGFGVIAGCAGRVEANAQGGTPEAGQLEANKDLVRHFYDAFYGARATGDVDVIDQFVAADYIQHEPGVPPGRDGLKELIRNAAGRSPKAPALLHLVADGDVVMAHQIVPGSDPAGPLAAEGVDIFRIADGMLVEHWGVDADYSEQTGDATPTA